jgi:hypothetical protein
MTKKEVSQLRALAAKYEGDTVSLASDVIAELTAIIDEAEKPCKCYALALYTYDHYEWEEVVAVSFDQSKLRDEHEQLPPSHTYKDVRIIRNSAHRAFAERGESHWLIKEVKFT